MRLLAACGLALTLTSGVAVSAEHPQSIALSMHEFFFRPAVIRLDAGRPVTLRVSNRGQIAHQFDAPLLRSLPVIVIDSSIHVETSGLDVLRLQPGASATVVFTPKVRGRYRFACTIEGHQEAGMVGYLLVR